MDTKVTITLKLALIVTSALATGCFESAAEKDPNYGKYLVTTDLGYGGVIEPQEVYVYPEATTQFKIEPQEGYQIGSVEGCEGELAGDIYTTGTMTQDCQLDVSFVSTEPTSYVVNAEAITDGGTVTPDMLSGEDGSVLQFSVIPDDGYVAQAVGCEGTLQRATYTTAPLAAPCDIEVSFLEEQAGQFVVTTSVTDGGAIYPDIMTVLPEASAQFYLEPGRGFEAVAEGCDGTQSGNIFNTAPVSDDCHVNVVFNNVTPDSFVLTAEAEEGGTITPTMVAATIDTVTQFQVDPPTDQRIGEATGCGEVNIDLENNTITTPPIEGHCDLYVTFEDDRAEAYIVSASEAVHGELTPEMVSVPAGGSTQLEVTPDVGYTAVNVEGCGGYLSGSVYNTGPITEHCEVTAQFERAGPDSSVVSASAGNGGTIAPEMVRIQENSYTSFLVTPDQGFGIESVEGCDGELTGNIYTTGPITENCAVEAQFTPVFYVATSTTTGGNITPDYAEVKPGEATEFQISPSNGFAIDNVLGCNGTLDGFVFETGPITSNCNISVIFTSGYLVTTGYTRWGTYDPSSLYVLPGEQEQIEIIPDPGYRVVAATGCGGTLSTTSGPDGAKMYNFIGTGESCEISAVFERDGGE